MTTKTTGTLLEPVGAALVAANLALGVSAASTPAEREGAEADVEQSLVALACAACDAVAVWEASARDEDSRDQTALAARLTSWRGQVDDLRVQLSLAQLELRNSPHHALVAVEGTASAVERALASAAHEVAATLGSLRATLRLKD